MSDILDMLLRPEVPNVQKDLPRGRYKHRRLSKAAGADVVFELQALPYGRVEELQKSEADQSVHIVLNGVVSPNLKDPRLAEKFGAVTPAEVVKAMLLPGEIEDLSRAIERLSGFRAVTIEEIKNG